MQYNTYIDESGNTGNNLVDRDQKYLVLRLYLFPKMRNRPYCPLFKRNSIQSRRLEKLRLKRLDGYELLRDLLFYSPYSNL